MLCFNCGSPLSSSDFCGNCGAQVTVYKKIIRMSNTYYNMGLVKATNRDLSGAADILRRSLKLNKKNTKARNLLGLVYFEMGETVQALKEWIISTNFRPEKNPAQGYLDKVRSNQNKLDELNQTVKKFNVALSYAQQGNDDMAIIQLKKVLSQNPNLVKGYQLLSLIYMKNGEYEKARKAILRALQIDKCNPLSLRYKREVDLALNIRTEKKQKEEKKKKYLSGNDVIIPSHVFKEPPNGAVTILNIILGLIIGGLAVYFILTPVKVKNEVDKNNDIVREYNQKLAIKNSSVAELERQVQSLTKEKNNLQKKVNKYTKADKTISNNYNNLIAAYDAYAKEEYDQATQYFEQINTDVTMDSESYNTVYASLKEQLASYVFDSNKEDAQKAYNSGDYDTAIQKYNECIKADETFEEGYYRIAWCYYNKGDTKKSQEYFKQVIDKFPNGRYASSAKAYVPKETSTEE